MVRRVIRLLLMLLGLVMVGRAVAAPAFSLTVAPGPAEYGRPIPVELLAERLQPRLDALDLSALDADFVVRPLENVDVDSQAGRQRWRLQLVPRRPGLLRIPPLTYADTTTAAVQISVAPASEGRQHAPIEVRSRLSANSGWLRQPLELVMEIETPSRYVGFEVDAVKQAGVELIPIPHSASPAAGGRTLHRLGWRIIPQQPGHLSVQLPPVNYRRDGVITHRFYPPRLALDIKPLPSYLPATLPVGPVALQMILPEPWYVRQGALRFITLRLSGQGATDRDMAHVIRQIRVGQGIRFYPASETGAKAGQDGGASGEIEYRLPFTSNAVGLLSLPPIRLQYFDPDSGRIETRIQAPGRLLVLSAWMIWAAEAVLLLLAGLVLRTVWQRLLIYARRVRAYRTALARIRQADSAAALRTALADIAEAEAWPVNLTLADWARRWRARYPKVSGVADSVYQLQGQLYGRSGGDVDMVRAGLLSGCVKRMPLLRVMG